MKDSLPPEITGFLSSHITSIIQLELVLLLRASKPRRWTIFEMARELRVESIWTQNQANDLCRRGLLECDGEEPQRFWYDPPHHHVDQLIARLADLYDERFVSIVTQIYSRPVSRIEQMSEAFRIRSRIPDEEDPPG